MTVPEVLELVRAAGVSLRVEGAAIVASPSSRLTEALRNLIRTHRSQLLAALSPQPMAVVAEPATTATAASHTGAECMRCANLTMCIEHHEGTRRVFWWRCERGYALMEGRNFGERVLLAPPECADFKQWTAGVR